jgi:hypothetical protein
MARLFPPPWRVEQIPDGFKVKDANGQSLAYVYGRESKSMPRWQSVNALTFVLNFNRLAVSAIAHDVARL